MANQINVEKKNVNEAVKACRDVEGLQKRNAKKKEFLYISLIINIKFII
jgi:hypothetical protein